MAGTTWQARARRWFKAHRLVVGVVLGLLVITGVSSAVWVTASKGSKEADLGSSLFSGLVVGVALLIVGKMFDNTARHAQYERTRQSSGESIVSTDSVEVT